MSFCEAVSNFSDVPESAYSRASDYDIDEIRKYANLILKIEGRGYLFLEITGKYVYFIYGEGKGLMSVVKEIVDKLSDIDIIVTVSDKAQLRLYKKVGFHINAYTLRKNADG